MNEDVEALLGRARGHLLRAALESLEATRVLLEAATLASGLQPDEGNSLTDDIQRRLIEMVELLRKGGEDGRIRLPEALIRPFTIAVEHEIARWEKRSETDPDARAVLRAFLGLRELLWEFGVRSPESGPPSPSGASASRTSPPPPPASSASSYHAGAGAGAGAGADPAVADAAPPSATSDGPLAAPRTKSPRKRVQRFDIEQ